MASFPSDPFTSQDLDALGLSRADLRRGREHQLVRRVLRGVFVAAEVPDSFELRLRATALVVAAGHVACDRTAAWVHGVDTFTYAEREIHPPVETCVLPTGWATRSAEVRGRSRDLRPDEIEDHTGLRVTTPLRTALDLACHLRTRDALAALDQFHRLYGIGSDDLLRELPRFRGRRGVVQARSLAPLVDGRAESARESWVRSAIATAGLPLPDVQVWVERDGVETYRLDLAYRAHRVAVEYDGDEFHRTEEQQTHDQERRDWLRSEGWVVVVVRRGDFTGDGLHRWLDRVRRALEGRYSNLRW